MAVLECKKNMGGGGIRHICSPSFFVSSPPPPHTHFSSCAVLINLLIYCIHKCKSMSCLTINYQIILAIFLTGRRACLGEQLARMDIFLFLASLLSRYSFKAPDGTEMPSILEGQYGGSRTPLPYAVIISKRGT